MRIIEIIEIELIGISSDNENNGLINENNWKNNSINETNLLNFI